MSTIEANIADVMAARGVNATDMAATIRRAEAVQAVRFAFHPWKPLPNFGADTFKFNVPYPVLPRLSPIALWTVERPIIHENRRGSLGMIGVSTYTGSGERVSHEDSVRGFGDSSGFGGMVPSGGGARVTRVPQVPQESVLDLIQAWGALGMEELRSLAASDARELSLSYLLFDAVMLPALDDEDKKAGRRLDNMPLEEYPAWLADEAQGVLKHALSRGVYAATPQGLERRVLPREFEERGEQLIAEISASVHRAVEFAVNPANGVLAKTRKAMQIAKTGAGEGGKTHYDELDEWLMNEFKKFPMDTDVDRAQRAVTTTIKQSAEAEAGIGNGLLAVVRQNQQVLEMLAEGQKQNAQLIRQLAMKNAKQQ